MKKSRKPPMVLDPQYGEYVHHRMRELQQTAEKLGQAIRQFRDILLMDLRKGVDEPPEDPYLRTEPTYYRIKVRKRHTCKKPCKCLPYKWRYYAGVDSGLGLMSTTHKPEKAERIRLPKRVADTINWIQSEYPKLEAKSEVVSNDSTWQEGEE